MLWNLFRQLPEARAFYEPLHDQLASYIKYPIQADRSHLFVKSYFDEFQDIPNVVTLHQNYLANHRIFLESDDVYPELHSYLQGLIESVSTEFTAIFKFNRIDFRLAWIKKNFPNVKILHLFRNPRDQWYSTWATFSGEIDQLIDFDQYYLATWARDLYKQFPFLVSSQIEHSYQRYYFLWKLSYLAGKRLSDLSVAYEEILEKPYKLMTEILDFSNLYSDNNLETCLRIITGKPERIWKKDRSDDWFLDLEKKCEQLLDEFGLNTKFALIPLSEIQQSSPKFKAMLFDPKNDAWAMRCFTQTVAQEQSTSFEKDQIYNEALIASHSERDKLSLELDIVRSELDHVYHSHSWKYTYPLRVVATAARKVKRRFFQYQQYSDNVSFMRRFINTCFHHTGTKPNQLTHTPAQNHHVDTAKKEIGLIMVAMKTPTIAPVKHKRIFWLGMHKLLVQTELPRLRMLGYEVFHPPYLSDTIDQSAVYDWRLPPDTTLPPGVIKKLMSTQFFYKRIPQDIAELLNIYFDAVIVTINPDWVHEFLKIYHGTLIYRVYGQPHSLSNHLLNKGTIRLITERESFWFSPHTDKTLTIEDPWLLNNMRIIPYCLSDDVVKMQDSWAFAYEQVEMGMMCPRATDNPYYINIYNRLKHYFPRKNYNIFGVQIMPMDDPQVVGTLPRVQFLERLREQRGFIYQYDEQTVCYLPPLEFMTIGGPVVFQKGSLLARFFKEGARAPGYAHDIYELRDRASLVEEGDQGLIEEIIESQKPVRQLYHPDYVWPIFDHAMPEMLDGESPAPASNILRIITQKPSEPPKRILASAEQVATQPQIPEIVLAFHKFGPLIQKHGEEYFCTEGIARVVRIGVRALTEQGYRVVVTAYKKDVGKVHGFFSGAVSDQTHLQVLAINGTWHETYLHRLKTASLALISMYKKKFTNWRKQARIAHMLTRSLGTILVPNYSNLVIAIILLPLSIVLYLSRRFLRLLVSLVRHILAGGDIHADYIAYLDDMPDVRTIWVPHYYLFPETADIKTKKFVLYLPDYLPYFYEGVVEMGSTSENEHIGKAICERADRIFTNSRFTQNYLPETVLKVDPKKIRYFPLPNLNSKAQDRESGKREVSVGSLPDHYVFYPTRERSSKRLWDFVDTVAAVNKRLARMGRSERLFGILTTNPSEQLFENNPQARRQIKVMNELNDTQLYAVYRQATALLFTSEMEGNFPPQIIEALNLQVPVIATRIPLITDELGDRSQHLMLVNVGDIDGFTSAVLSVMDDRNGAIAQQDPARTFVVENFSYKIFSAGIISVFEEVSPCMEERKGSAS